MRAIVYERGTRDRSHGSLGEIGRDWHAMLRHRWTRTRTCVRRVVETPQMMWDECLRGGSNVRSAMKGIIHRWEASTLAFGCAISDNLEMRSKARVGVVRRMTR